MKRESLLVKILHYFVNTAGLCSMYGLERGCILLIDLLISQNWCLKLVLAFVYWEAVFWFLKEMYSIWNSFQCWNCSVLNLPLSCVVQSVIRRAFISREKMKLWFILFALDVLILPEEVEWIKFNVGMNGYYIVHYEDDGWDSLTGLLKETHTSVSSNDRASLINNAFQLVR